MQSSLRFLVALTLIFVTAFPVSVSAEDSTSILISEILTGTSTGAGQEFVELYNPTAGSVSLDGWSVEYKSATSSNWTKKSDLKGTLAAQSYYLVAPKNYYPDSDADWSSTLSSSGGHVRLIDISKNVIDLVGYGNADSAEGSPALAPPANQSIERLPGKTAPLGGNGVDSGENSKDFVVRIDPEPQNSKSEVEPRTDDVVSDPNPVDEAETVDAETSHPLIISELFIDPMFPLTDADDEFIELFNPNDFSVDYGGYILKGGTNFRSSYELPSGILPPRGFVAFVSSQTRIPLTNSGGSVQLFDPSGRLIDQTQDYSNAKSGQSWTLDNGVWNWSLLPTKGAQNVITLPAAVASAATAKKISKPTALKSAKVKAPAKAKKASSKASKVKSFKEAKKKANRLKSRPQGLSRPRGC